MKLLLCFYIFFLTHTSGFGETISKLASANDLKNNLIFLPIGLWYILLAAILMAIISGILGSFLVVKRLSMVGDTLSHAVLPGLLVGFCLFETKNPMILFFGAMFAGFLSILLVHIIRLYLPIKEDGALAIVLAGFYGIGIALLSYVQQTPLHAKAGIDKILFGQAAALDHMSVLYLGVIMIICLLWMVLLFRSTFVSAFDQGFAASLGWPVQLIENIFLILLTMVIVVNLQTSGIILISALLIIPASSAYLWTKNFKYIILLAVLIALISTMLGVFLSLLKTGIPTGPCIIVVAGGIFIFSWLLNPEGVLYQWKNKKHLAEMILVENILKAFYLILESNHFSISSIQLNVLADKTQLSLKLIKNRVNKWVKKDYFEIIQTSSVRDEEIELKLTELGRSKAEKIVRNHRLWELYLTDVAHYPADHVHEDAEKMEHILGDDLAQQLTSRLNYPKKDPHGRDIP